MAARTLTPGTRVKSNDGERGTVIVRPEPTGTWPEYVLIQWDDPDLPKSLAHPNDLRRLPAPRA